MVKNGINCWLCYKVAKATGADEVPAVRETLGKMSALESTLSGMIYGQIENAKIGQKILKHLIDVLCMQP